MHLPAAHGDHGLDAEGHPRTQANAVAGEAKIGHGRILMHAAADAVSGQIPNHAIAVRFRMGLHGRADIPDAVAVNGHGRAAPEAFLRHADQIQLLLAHLPHRAGKGAVRLPAVQGKGHVDGDDGAFLHFHVFRRDAVHHFIVNGGADGGGIAFVAKLCRNGAVFADQLIGVPIDGGRGDARHDGLAHLLEHIMKQMPRAAHFRQLIRILDDNHAMPKAFRTA